MIEVWRRWRESGIAVLIAVFAIQSFNSCFSLNDEGLALLRFKERLVSDPFEALSGWNDDVGVSNPCSWPGVKCINGNVAILNLKDLCLGGTLGTDLRSLVHIKLIILRNNSFYGVIPEMFQELKELEVLLDNNNDLFSCISPELNKLKLVSEAPPNSSQRCEMDRIVRPGGHIIVQDTVEMISSLGPILRSLHWSTNLYQEQFLVGKKHFWRPNGEIRI